MTANATSSNSKADRLDYNRVAVKSLWFNISVVFSLFLFLSSYFTSLLANSRNIDIFLIGQFRGNPGMTSSQKESFYWDYISMLQDRLNLTYDVSFILGSMALFATTVLGVTALIERKKFRSAFHPLPSEIQKKIIDGAGADMSRFEIGKTLGATCVRLRNKQILLSPDHLLACLKDPKFSAEILQHELIHSIARDPAFNFIFNALLYVAIAPIFLVAFLGGGAAIAAMEEASGINTGVTGSLIILAWIGGSGFGLFKIRQAASRKFYNAKEAFAEIDFSQIEAHASWVYFTVLMTIALGYTAHPDTSASIGILVSVLLISTLFTAQVRIAKTYALALAFTVITTSAWFTKLLINYVKMLIARDPSSFEVYQPTVAELLKYSEILPLAFSGFMIIWSFRR